MAPLPLEWSFSGGAVWTHPLVNSLGSKPLEALCFGLEVHINWNKRKESDGFRKKAENIDEVEITVREQNLVHPLWTFTSIQALSLPPVKLNPSTRTLSRLVLSLEVNAKEYRKRKEWGTLDKKKRKKTNRDRENYKKKEKNTEWCLTYPRHLDRCSSNQVPRSIDESLSQEARSDHNLARAD